MRRILPIIILCALALSCKPEGERPVLRYSGLKGEVSDVTYRYYIVGSDVQDELEKVISAYYDQSGRLVRKTIKFTDGSQDTDLAVGYEGDVATSLVQKENVIGKEFKSDPSASPTDGHDHIHRTYNKHGYLTSEIIDDKDITRSIFNRYDRNDNLVKMVVKDSKRNPKGTVTRYRYKEFDSTGNWTLCFSKSDGVTKKIEREINYR